MSDRRFLSAFTEVVRSGPLRETVNLQEATFAAGQLLEQVPEGHPIDLGALYNYLLERNNPRDAVQQSFMALIDKCRELGILVAEPDEISRMDDILRGNLLRNFNRGRQSAGYQKPGPDGSPTPGKKAENPNAGGGKNARQRGLLIVLASVLGLGGVAIGVNLATREPSLQPVKLSSARGLICAELLGNPPSLFCRTDEAEFKRVDPDIMAARAKATLEAAGASYDAVYLETVDGSRILKTYLKSML